MVNGAVQEDDVRVGNDTWHQYGPGLKRSYNQSPLNDGVHAMIGDAFAVLGDLAARLTGTEPTGLCLTILQAVDRRSHSQSETQG